jgi:ABC-2 type transport system permease protein
MIAVYFAVGKARFLSRLAYPESSIFGIIFAQITATLVTIFIWKATYNGAQTLDGYTINQTLIYILTSRSLAVFSNSYLIQAVGYSLLYGQITKELLRPVDFQAMLSASAVAQMIFHGFFVFSVWIISSIYLGIELPANPVKWIMFIVFVTLGIVNSLLIDWIFTCMVFFTLDPMGIVWLRQTLVNFLGGAIIPLHFMPIWLSSIAKYSPFYQIIHVPSGLISGTLLIPQAMSFLFQGLIWTIVLFIASRLALRFVFSKIIVQGG